MAISRNLTLGPMGVGRAANGESEGAAKLPVRGGLGNLAGLTTTLGSAPSVITATLPPPVVAQPPAEAPATGVLSGNLLGAVGAVGGIRDFGIRPPVFTPPILELPPGFVFHPQVDKTTTQIAQGAQNHLRGADAAVIREAVSNIKHKDIAADDLLNYLERRTRVGEVLNDLASDWSAQTKKDFAEAFQMPDSTDKLPVMDAMVSISILNDPDLKNELLAENMIDASQGDLLENRRIVWQWPQPGTAFTPPYLIVVAVEKQDTTKAENIIQSIIGDQVDFQGYKIPSAAVQKLR